jgi:hypothetical protein
MPKFLSILFIVLFSFSAFAQQHMLSDYGAPEVSGKSIVDDPMAPVVFLNQAPNQVNGLMADSSCAICGTFQQSVAENFNVVAAGPTYGITEVVIWGGYYPENIPNTTDDFTFMFHSDAAGSPGAVFDTRYNLQADSRVSTGVILFGVNEYLFTFDFSASPIMIGSTGTYWIEIYNNSVESGNFFWETGNLDATNGVVGSAWTTATPGVTWNLDPATELSIQISGDDNIGGGGGTSFFEDFEGFVPGQQLACQDPVNWTTWSNAPCGNEDALISTNYAYSGTNSFLVDAVAPRAVDIVKPLGDLTSGLWYLDFMAYIPTGKFGYFNVMATFAPPTYVWATQAYFNAGGTGTLDAGGASAATFTFPHDTWFPVSLVIDLDNDQAQLTVNGVFVYQWQYTLGTFGTPCPLVIAATDMFGPDATPTNNEMYVDDYRFSDTPLPVELTSFTAISNNGIVELNWETATEINNHGFEIERRSESSEFRTIGFVEGNGTTTETRNYSYVDKTVDQGINYYRLKQVDFDGTYSYSDEVEVDVTAPLAFDLAQNYPNPFNPSTKIFFSLAVDSKVTLKVFDVLGQEVATLYNNDLSAGSHNVTFDAVNLNSGVYFYRIEATGINGANFIDVKKMILAK